MTQEEVSRLKRELELKHAAFERELDELRRQIADNKISTQQAHERIDRLERSLAELKTEMAKITETVSQFSPKLDDFMKNLWKLVFALLAIVAGLVGIKLF